MAKTDGTSGWDVPRLTDGEHDQQQEMSGSHRPEVTRRQLLGVAAGTAILTGLPRYAHAAEAKGEVPRRTLGGTGEKVSAIGLGGYHLGKKELPEAESIRIIRTAIDNGIDFLDNCWDYNGGQSEIRMGKGLQNSYRQRAFLMTKIDGRDKKTAAQQIEDSLRRLKTDRIDLLQFHEIIRTNDPDRIFAAGGAMEAALEAKQAGKIRYICFTGHKSPAIHLNMLQTAAKNQFRFETVQMPLNVMDAHYDSFEEKVLPVLVKNNIGVLGMKPMGDHFILETKTATPIQCLHYSMSLPTSVVITGCDSMKILEQALIAARTFRPLEPSEIKAILAKTGPAAQQGKYELYKTSHHFDGTYQNPQWLG